MSITNTIPPTLLVLAAGMGSRYGGLKQIDPVGPSGEAIMDYSIYDALRAGFGRVVFVIRKDIEAAFREQVGARFEGSVAVDYVFQEMEDLPGGFDVPAGRTKPWGTTHAILAAREAIAGPFAVINADDFYGASSYRLLAEFIHAGQTEHEYAMAGFVLRNTLSEFGSVARGVCRVDADGRLTHVEELTGITGAGGVIQNTDKAGNVTALTGDEAVSMNIWAFTPEVFAQLEAKFVEFLTANAGGLTAECYIPSTVNDLVAAGLATVQVLRSEEPWFGVTYREDRPRVVESIQKLVAAGVYPAKLWA